VNWTTNLFDRRIVPEFPRFFYLVADGFEWGITGAVFSFLAIGVLWSIQCCRAVTADISPARAVLVTANAIWFVAAPFFLLAVGTPSLDLRQEIGLSSVNARLWMAALWICAIAAASKALQYEAKAPAVFAVLFAFAGYGTLIVLRILLLI
jgi:hypothetical protein